LAIETEKYVVIATAPLGGNAPVTTFFDLKADAKAWADTHLTLYGRIDFAEVQLRARTTLRPETVVERIDPVELP